MIYSTQRVASLHGERVIIDWVTGRDTDMFIPGGMQIRGVYVEGNLHYLVDFDREPDMWRAVNGFAIEWDRAAEKAAEEADYVNALDLFRPKIRKGGQFILAFRESEAAQAAYDAGYRSHLVGEEPAWPALAKVEEAAKAAA